MHIPELPEKPETEEDGDQVVRQGMNRARFGFWANEGFVSNENRKPLL